MVSIDVTSQLHFQVGDLFTMIMIQPEKIDVVAIPLKCLTQSRMQRFSKFAEALLCFLRKVWG